MFGFAVITAALQYAFQDAGFIPWPIAAMRSRPNRYNTTEDPYLRDVVDTGNIIVEVPSSLWAFATTAVGEEDQRAVVRKSIRDGSSASGECCEDLAKGRESSKSRKSERVGWLLT